MYAAAAAFAPPPHAQIMTDEPKLAQGGSPDLKGRSDGCAPEISSGPELLCVVCRGEYCRPVDIVPCLYRVQLIVLVLQFNIDVHVVVLV